MVAMGSWKVDATSEPGVLRLTLIGNISEEEMRAFVLEHNSTIDAYAGADYKVWCDISQMRPLGQAAANLLESAKKHSASKPNFRGSAVKVSSATVALQHRRTSIGGGVMSTELISDDEDELRAHLKKVYRQATNPGAGG
jgi:hypothetical protein